MSEEARQIIEEGAFTLPEVIAEVVCEALSLFAETSLDFVDCILIARHRILGEEIASFDKKLN